MQWVRNGRSVVFFFQAEDGIRDLTVTGVQTCALPIYEPGKLYLGIDRPKTTMSMRQGATHIGELQAWDMSRGQRVWTHTFRYMNWGPVLTTGGGLVFLGGTNDRHFRAFDAKTGSLLWEFKTNSGVTGVPSSFAVDGVQYIAVQSGWGVDRSEEHTSELQSQSNLVCRLLLE